MSYYTRWRTIIGTSLFQRFIQENYALGVSDLKLLERSIPFSQKNFSCLLCGVGNEETARSYIQFVLKRNPQACIFIIDLGTEQVDAVKKLVDQNFKQYDITIKQMNALNLATWLKNSSLDWIETDGFLEFFSPDKLLQLLKVWHILLKSNGFITIREPASNNNFESFIDICRIKMGKWWLGIKLYVHTLEDLKKIEGGFVAQSSFDDWVSYISDEMGQAGLNRNGIHMMGCCPPEGMRGLWEAWSGAVEEKPEGVYINLCISRDHLAASVSAGSLESGSMDVRAKQTGGYFIRTPAWAEHGDIILTVNGRPQPTEWGGPSSAYVKTDLTSGDIARIAWPVPRFTQTYNPTSIPDREYDLTVEWTGNRVDGVSPKGEYLPLF